MSSFASLLIGVDVGSTTTSGGLVTPAGEVVWSTEVATHRGGPGTALDTILGVVDELLERAAGCRCHVEGIGIGLPGVVDVEGGTMRKGIHLVPELTGSPIVESVRGRSRLPTFIDNDVNALALAEWTWGLARGATSMVMLALGTGVGGAVILDGRLLRGRSGYAGEFGHVSVKLDGRPCVCGTRGCLAAYVAGFGIAMEARHRGDIAGGHMPAEIDYGSDAATVFRAAEEGDAGARALVDEACLALGAAIGGMATGLNPDVIVITGGIVKSLVPFESQITRHAADYALSGALEDARVHLAPGHKSQTVRGGAALVLYEGARRPGAVAPVPSRAGRAAPEDTRPPNLGTLEE